MSFFENNTKQIEKGMLGEGILREYLKTKDYEFMQVDLIVDTGEDVYIVEVKTQEKFKAPPFDGHGLPEYQIRQRIRISEKLGAVPVLYVYDLDEKFFYFQDMRKLMQGEHIITKKNPRIIFPLSSFQILKIT